MINARKGVSRFLKIKRTNLSSWIIDFCLKNKIKWMTPMQQACIPSILLGKDIMVFSRTGTGKTFTYILPSVQRIESSRSVHELIIILPTQELSFQVFDIIQAVGQNRKNFFFFFPKKNEKKNFEKIETFRTIKKKCFIFTPDSFFFFLKKCKFRLSKKEHLMILDESDLLLGEKFYFQIELAITTFKPKQILVFAASITKNLDILKFPKIKKKIFCFYENKKKFCLIQSSNQEYFFCPYHLKIFYLWLFLKSKYKSWSGKNEKKNLLSIVFVSTPKLCDYIAEKLKKNNISTVKLHEGMNRLARLLSTQLLKMKQIKILICTDLGNRGLDFPLVDLVINFDFPKKINIYLHRMGRALRFFKKGNCLNIISQNEIHLLHFFEKKTGIKLTKSRKLEENEILKILSNQCFKW